jgi:hypothetical protein
MTTPYSELPNIPCTKCGEAGGLEIEQRLEALPLGTYSLAGAMLKVSARYWPWMVCKLCGAESRGKVD